MKAHEPTTKRELAAEIDRLREALEDARYDIMRLRRDAALDTIEVALGLLTPADIDARDEARSDADWEQRGDIMREEGR